MAKKLIAAVVIPTVCNLVFDLKAYFSSRVARVNENPALTVWLAFHRSPAGLSPGLNFPTWSGRLPVCFGFETPPLVFPYERVYPPPMATP